MLTLTPTTTATTATVEAKNRSTFADISREEIHTGTTLIFHTPHNGHSSLVSGQLVTKPTHGSYQGVCIVLD